jgi:hypothetical protein
MAIKKKEDEGLTFFACTASTEKRRRGEEKRRCLDRCPLAPAGELDEEYFRR